ncbi:arylesterase [Phyllobacterium salinisoli]|uniref:Arylesterase n=1 Tax=Phyllobacterium salinisoli TaxID=1899321 RepID=A0A368KA57_9HYPH|nr:arylesterase [Phyllobacterium salinisoli]
MRFKLAASFVFILGLIVAPMAQADQINTDGAPVRIVGFGDSLMAGYQLPPQDAFPARLEQALKKAGYNVAFENAGVSGDTTAGGLARLDWSVPDGTQIVILELGANDALRGVSPDITEKNLDDMLARLKQRGITVILAGMLAPPNMGKDFGDRFNAIYPRLAKKYGVVLYPFFLDGVTAQKALLLEDGMHPNPDGVARMVEGILPTVEAVLQQIGKEPT